MVPPFYVRISEEPDGLDPFPLISPKFLGNSSGKWVDRKREFVYTNTPDPKNPKAVEESNLNIIYTEPQLSCT